MLLHYYVRIVEADVHARKVKKMDRQSNKQAVKHKWKESERIAKKQLNGLVNIGKRITHGCEKRKGRTCSMTWFNGIFGLAPRLRH